LAFLKTEIKLQISVSTKTTTKIDNSVEVSVHSKILISECPRIIIKLLFLVLISANNKTKIKGDISGVPKL